MCLHSVCVCVRVCMHVVIHVSAFALLVNNHQPHTHDKSLEGNQVTHPIPLLPKQAQHMTKSPFIGHVTNLHLSPTLNT